MFKEYCHMSSLTQCYNILQPYNPINNKKKDILLSNPARARKSKSIDFIYTLVSPTPTTSQEYLFVLHYFALVLRTILFLIRSDLLLPHFVRHLASASLFFYSPCRAQTTRFAQTIK
jgi:hypothetical protein